jgi:hypothetical protein
VLLMEKIYKKHTYTYTYTYTYTHIELERAHICERHPESNQHVNVKVENP